MQREKKCSLHPAYRVSKKAQEICRPAFDKLRVNYIDYARFYPDGNISAVFTDADYIKFFLNHPEYKSNKPNKILTPGLHLWDSYISRDFLTSARTDFQHSHGLTILKSQEEYFEIINFATHPENKTILFTYLNQQPLLHEFVDYFRNKSQQLLISCGEGKLGLANIFSSSESEGSQNQSQIINIFFNENQIQLTSREAQCLYLLTQGKSTKLIARNLNISPRTVEIYITNIRQKTLSRNRLELLSCLGYENIRLLANHYSMNT